MTSSLLMDTKNLISNNGIDSSSVDGGTSEITPTLTPDTNSPQSQSHDGDINKRKHVSFFAIEESESLDGQTNNVELQKKNAGTKTIASTAMSSSKSSHLVKPIVPSSGYGKSGKIDFRANQFAILSKKWTKGGYWLHVYPATINLFNSLKDLETWKELDTTFQNDSDSLDMNKKKYMNQLLKKSINFDSTGALKKKMIKLEEKISGIRTSKKKVADNENEIALRKTYIMEEVRSKYYYQNDHLMHTCKISYLGINGRHISVAFGSTVPLELKRIRAVVGTIVNLVRKFTKKHAIKTLVADVVNYNPKTTGIGQSVISAVSDTIYHPSTKHHV